MITYKIVLDERRAKAGGKYSIVFRITSNRITSNYSSGVAVPKEQWNFESATINSTCPNYRELNRNLSTKYLKVQKLILQLEEEGCFTFDEFKLRMNSNPNPTKQKAKFKLFAEELIADMHAVNRTGNALVYQTAVNRLLAFTNGELSFEQLDFVLLDKFKNQLLRDGARPNTIGNYFRSIRAIYNRAIKAKLVDRLHYPFGDITIKTERTLKRALAQEDVKKLYQSVYPIDSPKQHARNYFILSYALRGMSFTDLAYLTTNHITKGRIIYKRKKTGTLLNVQLLPIVENILNHYRDNSHGYLLPIFDKSVIEGGVKAKTLTRQWIKNTNKWLRRIATDCNIEADITTYVTRHSWATHAKKLGYSNELIAECMGHQYGNKITNIYLDSFDQSLIDSVNINVTAGIH